MIYLREMVEDVRIQSRIHPLSGTTRREAATTPKKYLHCRQRVDILVMDTDTLKCKIEVIEICRMTWDVTDTTNIM